MGVIMSKEFHRAPRCRPLAEEKGVGLPDQAVPRRRPDRPRPEDPAGSHRLAGSHRPGRPQPPRGAVRRRGRHRTDVAARRDQTHDDAYDYAQTLTLTVNPANGAMEVLRGAAIGARSPPWRGR